MRRKKLEELIDLKEQKEKLRRIGWEDGRIRVEEDGITILPEGRKEKRSITIDKSYGESLEMIAWYERRSFSELVEEAVAMFLRSEGKRLREALNHREEFERWKERSSKAR